MDRRGLTRSLVAATMCAGALVGCTGGDGIEVVVDGDQDPGVELAAMVEATRTSSGRFTQTARWDMGAMAEAFTDADAGAQDAPATSDDGGAPATTLEFHSDGEFAGDDLHATMRSTVDVGDGPVDIVQELLVVGGATYTTNQELPESPGLDVDLSPGSAVAAALGDRRWIEQPVDDPAGDGVASDLAGMGPGFGGPEDTWQLLGSLATVSESAPVEVDGETLRSFSGTADPDQFWGVSTDAGLSEEYQPEGVDPARLDRIERYRAEHVHLDVAVLVDPDGLLRRVEVAFREDIEEDYRTCVELMTFGEGTVTLEFRDLGDPVEVAAPDPADVMPAAEYEAVVDRWSADLDAELSAGLDLGPAEELDAEYRADLEQEVVDGAYLIGLDPASVPGMTEEELYDALDRIVVAAEDAPTTPTALGEMSRPDLLWHVRAGMEREGVDPATADGLTDEQLAALIDAYMADPALAGKVPEEYVGLGDEDEDWAFDWLEGCPG